MRQGLAIAMLVAAAVGLASPASGYKSFHDKWVELYVDESNSTEEAEEFSELVHGKDRCLVCHQGKTKKECNPYGEHFIGLIGKTDQKDFAKIEQAIKEVGDKKSDPDDPASKTYAELIKEHELPGGKFEDLKKKKKKK